MASTRRKLAWLSKGRAPFILYRRTKNVAGKTVLLRPWCVRFTGYNGDGQRRQLRIALKTEDRALAEQLAWENYSEKAGPGASAGRDPYIGPLLHEYRRHLKAYAKPKTARERWYVLRRFFRKTFPQWNCHRLSEITHARIRTYIEDRRLNDGVAAWTAADVRKALSALFTYARNQHGFMSDPIKRVRAPRTNLAPIDYLKREEILPVLEAVKAGDPAIFLPVATAIFAGLRLSELVWLTTASVDLAARIIWVCRKTIESKRYETKTGKSRVIPISGDLLGHLEGYAPPETWFFPSIKGRRWNSNFLGLRLRKVIRSQGWRHTFQTFRHTFGSQLAQKGLSLYKISILMGNTEEVCRQHYAALCPAQMHEEVEFLRD